jgi:type VI secretion system protein
MSRGLLSRLGSSERGFGSGDERAEIVEHLRVLLNTRLGDSSTAPDFGVLDFSEVVHSLPGSVNQLQTSIRATLLRYEPRLTNVIVRYVKSDDPLQIRFEIIADAVDSKRGRGRLQFQTRLHAGGRFDVQT